jgi:hypothetical protein
MNTARPRRDVLASRKFVTKAVTVPLCIYCHRVGSSVSIPARTIKSHKEIAQTVQNSHRIWKAVSLAPQSPWPGDEGHHVGDENHRQPATHSLADLFDGGAVALGGRRWQQVRYYGQQWGLGLH